MSSPRRLATILAIILIAGGVVWFFGNKWYFNYRQYHNRPESHSFSGRTVAFKNDQTFILNGYHVNDKNPEYSDREHPWNVDVAVSSETRLVKTVTYLPTAAELKKAGGQIDISKYKTEESAGSLDDLKTRLGMTVIVTTANNSIADTVLKASEIDYTIIMDSK